MCADFMDHRSSIKHEIDRWGNLGALGPIGELIDSLEITAEQKNKLENLATNAQNLRTSYVDSLKRLLEYVKDE